MTAAKLNITEEIRRITNETAAAAASKALEVSELAKSRAAEVSATAMAKALEVATLAATKAADAASAAANIAASTSKDLEYIKKDIADTKQDIKAINDKLDNKYVSKEEFKTTKDITEKMSEKYITKDQFATVKNIVYGLVGLMLSGVVMGLMYMLIKR